MPNWFAALPVPAHAWLPRVLRELPSSCRGFDPDDVHMTVAFFGAMRESLVADVIETLDGVSDAPIPVRLGRLLALPKPRRPSAFSFSIAEGGEPAANLIGTWRDSLLAVARARPDHRPPLPHITVARPPRRASAEARSESLAWARNTEPPPDLLVLDRIALYTWADNRRIRQFKIVHECGLRSRS